jgi:hypothetical protein
MSYEPRPRPRPVKAVLDEQKQNAERDHAQRTAPKPAADTVTPAKISTAIAPAAKPALPAEMPPDNRSAIDRYLDDVAPAMMVGRQIRGTKDAMFVTPDDGETIPDTVDFIALCDQTMVGRVKFNGEGNPPSYRMGLLYDNFVPPRDEDLPDRDVSTWELGLDHKPQDPWAHFMYLVLQRGDTAELFTYTTSSVTGRRAVGNLLKHYNRMRKTHPDTFPVVRLIEGGFNHRDERVGWVRVPVFRVVGRHAADDVSKPDSSPSGDMGGDAIPF